ncbi:Nif3-like dinuclear metal center hexameric protein [Ideonella sp. BN130291]|uniref:Nif3-like dinuclear metal center hexameric protein n=1 Tax=Ideonella sp. BN130291 TaxID=3112940 RepID=UPI003FA608EE
MLSAPHAMPVARTDIDAHLNQLLVVERFKDYGPNGLQVEGPPYETLQALAEAASAALCRPATVVPGGGRPLRRIAWCTGGAQGYFEDAIAFITGEIAEPQTHYARETGVAFLACGHHATERYGVQAVGEHLAQQYGLPRRVIDIENPA